VNEFVTASKSRTVTAHGIFNTIRIGGEEYPYNLVKSKFLKLNSSHLQYVIGCMQNNTTKVANIKAYLITALYNAPNTISHYYNAEVNHDLYGID